MSLNYSEIKGTDLSNIVDTGTEGTKIALGTSAQRGTVQGQVRFNSSDNTLEYYDGNFYQQLTNAPTVQSINVTTINQTAGSSATTDITITGKNFNSGVTVKAIATDDTEVTAGTVVRNSSEELVATFTDSDFANADEPYDIKVINSDTQFGTLENVLYVDTASAFTTASGSLGTLTYSNSYASSNVTAVVAVDPDGEAVTYSISSGTIPTGLTFNSDGTWSGNANEPSSDTTYSFNVRATSNSQTTDRSFTIQVNAPQAQLAMGYSAGSGGIISSYSQSSALGGSLTAAKMYDNSLGAHNNCWHSAGGQGWAQWNFNQGIQIYRVKVQNRSDCCNNMANGTITAWDNANSQWITIGTVSLGGGSTAQQTFTSSNTTTYFTKIRFTSNSSNGGYTSIGEAGVYIKV
jgi:hypothetical protein